jgi:diguanylate cyclase (GGDEF)-like protein
MVAVSTDTASTIERREGLVPLVSAVTAAILALALHQTFPVMAAVTGAMAGAAAGTLLLRRALLPASQSIADRQEGRIRLLESELATQRAMHESFKAEAAARQAELERLVEDIDMTRSLLEGQASHSLELAEALAEQKQRSDYLAYHDPLTGLPNRRAFEDELKKRVDYASSSGLTSALLFVDLDRFKEVNDALGHEAGDTLLRQVADMFGAAVRHDDFVARIGGDEFAVIIEVMPEGARQVTSTLAERLRLALQITVPAPEGEILVGATIGVALCPEDAADAEGLLHAADRVMYVGKRRGRNRVVTSDELKGAA